MKNLLSIIASLGLDAYITPMQDEHLNEFINERDNYVRYLTGFTGTSGIAITAMGFKKLITDGRYYNQAEKQLTDYQLVKSSETSMTDLLKTAGFKKIGIDPHFISYGSYIELEMELNSKGIQLIDTENLVDIIWTGHGSRKFNPIIDLEQFEYIASPRFYDIIRALNSNRAKMKEEISPENVNVNTLSELYKSLLRKPTFSGFNLNRSMMLKDFKGEIISENEKPEIKFLVSSKPTGKNNTLNLEVHNRKSETPIVVKPKMQQQFQNIKNSSNITGTKRWEKIKKILSKIKKDEVLLITEPDTIAWIFNLRGEDVENNMFFYSYATLSHEHIILFSGVNIYIENIEIRKYYLFDDFIKTLKDKKVIISSMCNAFIGKILKNKKFVNFVREMQSIKSEEELYGALEANIIDSIALIKAFDKIIYSTAKFTENDVSKIINDVKMTNANFIKPSFTNIVGFGANSADMHHSISKIALKETDSILIDSGSQFIFGTTDITRTISRKPTEKMREMYTIVLKANLAAKFVTGLVITGSDVDSAARNLTKSYGFDFDSSTGHGIGSALNVHERPPLISTHGEKIYPNQIFTIEPGYYETGEFGIRIEDDVFLDKNGNIKELTYIPYHLELIDTSKLTPKEKNYINEYNRKIRLLLDPLIKDGPGSRYLAENTRVIS